ncbi:MAG: isoleucine--tRNA ligase, partial [Armatimonadetes bacterium]|nr:isoleucine--tRNA ligase [Armatimonadota bacterium]
MDYRPTLNLLQTDFPLKGNLPQREPEILKLWQEWDIYRLVRENRQGAPKYVLHDGPPYANGNIHLGQALNKILKDITIKYKTMRGHDCPYVPGWDTQGLPTEQSVAREYEIDRHSLPALQWRGKCRELALRYVDLQREQFKRLGVRGDWENPYLTLNPQYQARQIEAFAKIALKGLVYRRERPVYWCYTCETALAEDEIEYTSKRSPSIYVAFRVPEAGRVFSELPAGKTAEAVIWTTTPWTIPGNTATALSPGDQYVLARSGERVFILAQVLAAQTAADCDLGELEILATKPGKELEGLVAVHPLYGRPSPFVLADYVEMESGTGLVHTAPGHGLDDFETALRYDLPVISPVDDLGRFTTEAGEALVGQVVDQANDVVIALLDDAGALLNAGRIEHEYPHCWRCHLPVIYRATKQWFMDIDAVRQAALDEIGKAKWVPAWGESRIAGMVQARPDWCISRQRVWGVPIPVFYCAECGETLLTEASTSFVRDLVAEHGADVWFEREPQDLLPPGTTCGRCGSANLVKEPDIMSVWFDSGVTHYCVLDTHPELTDPADLYLEGDDQYQCWFQTSLWAAVALGKPAPFKTVVGHAFFVDETGHKLSKSKGNIIPPTDISEKYGADVLRMWFTYADFRRKMYAAESIYEQVADAYKKIRFTCRFMLQNLADFDPATDAVAYADLLEVDRWALSRLHWLCGRMTEAFDNWSLHLFYHEVHAFCATDLSAFYLNVLKDRLYTELPGSQVRRSAQTALWEILMVLVKIIAPVLTFTSEEIWQHCRKLDERLPISVQLADWPEPPAQWREGALEERWGIVTQVRDGVLMVLEMLKKNGVCDNPQEATVKLQVPAEGAEALQKCSQGSELQLATLMGVSSVTVETTEEPHLRMLPADVAANVSVLATFGTFVATAWRSEGDKCGRCWMTLPSVGDDA